MNGKKISEIYILIGFIIECRSESSAALKFHKLLSV